MEKKLLQYFNMPSFRPDELEQNSRATEFIQEKKNREAYDILFLMIQKYNNNDLTDRRARYISIRIGLIYVYAKMWDAAINAFAEAISYKDSVGNPFLHLRIGECAFHLGSAKDADDNLARALIMGGLSAFDGEDEALKKRVLQILQPPPDGWDSYTGQDWSATK